MEDTYRTLLRTGSAEIKVKGSRFIAEAMPVADAEEAQAALEGIRRRTFDATHHCSAYRLGAGGEIFRHHDDGEPSGTAGLPILRQIDARGLTDTLVVVTRYFGGTKLGTGGLIRAYGEAAARALDQAPVAERTLRDRVRLRFGYEDTAPAMRTIQRLDAEILETGYTEKTEIVVAVRRSKVDDFLAAFVEALSGRGIAERIEA